MQTSVEITLKNGSKVTLARVKSWSTESARNTYGSSNLDVTFEQEDGSKFVVSQAEITSLSLTAPPLNYHYDLGGQHSAPPVEPSPDLTVWCPVAHGEHSWGPLYLDGVMSETHVCCMSCRRIAQKDSLPRLKPLFAPLER